MKILYINVAVTVLALPLLIPETYALITKRCQSVCSRSDGQEFCQRCRMRVPMRFGKRTEMSRNIDSKNTIQHIPDDDDDESLEMSMLGTSPLSKDETIKTESHVLLNSMRNFVRDLEDWNRDFYEA